MSLLTLTEFELRRACCLSSATCDALRRLVPSVRIEPSLGMPGHFDLTPGSTVGAVIAGDVAVVIRPKIEMDRLLFLMSYALSPRDWKNQPFAFSQDASLVEAIIPAFVHHIRRAVRRGLLQRYRHEEAALQTVRGRLVMQEIAGRRFGLSPPVDVHFDEFTEDHLLHRLIKAALVRLERMLIRSEPVRRLLHKTLPLFDHVELESFDARRVPTVAYDRLTAHYRPAVELARLVLANSSFEHLHGTTAATAFLVDMNEVFERFVVVALRETLRLGPTTLRQGADLPLDVDRRVRLRPDLLWVEGGRPRFVGDVKYKALALAGYRHADLYQLLAYAIATDLPSGLLIYASGEGLPGEYRVRYADKSLEVRWLDLSGTPVQILATVSAVATRIAEMAEMATDVVQLRAASAALG